MATPIRTVTGTHGDPLAEAIELTRQLKLPHIRRALTDLIPTAKAQRWDPAEVVRVLLSGQAAIEAGMTVAWFTIEDLGALVRSHRADDSLARAMARLIRTDLIIVDDIGLLPVSPDAAEGFYQLVDAAYERRALAVSSNLHPSGFDEIMPKTLATATVDRRLHHTHVVVTQGDSFRLNQATSGQGVIP